MRGSRTRNRVSLAGPQQVAISRTMLGCLKTERVSISFTISSEVIHFDLGLNDRTVISEQSHCALFHQQPSLLMPASALL